MRATDVFRLDCFEMRGLCFLYTTRNRFGVQSPHGFGSLPQRHLQSKGEMDIPSGHFDEQIKVEYAKTNPHWWCVKVRKIIVGTFASGGTGDSVLFT